MSKKNQATIKVNIFNLAPAALSVIQKGIEVPPGEEEHFDQLYVIPVWLSIQYVDIPYDYDIKPNYSHTLEYNIDEEAKTQSWHVSYSGRPLTENSSGNDGEGDPTVNVTIGGD